MVATKQRERAIEREAELAGRSCHKCLPPAKAARGDKLSRLVFEKMEENTCFSIVIRGFRAPLDQLVNPTRLGDLLHVDSFQHGSNLIYLEGTANCGVEIGTGQVERGQSQIGLQH